MSERIINPDKIGELAKALSLARMKFLDLPKNKTVKVSKQGKFQYEFDFADLASILDSTKQALADNGLVVIQQPANIEDKFVLESILAHESGAVIISHHPLPNYLQVSSKTELNPAMQAMGSALAFAKRYALSAILGIAARDDDDGNMADGNDYQYGGKSSSRQQENRENFEDAFQSGGEPLPEDKSPEKREITKAEKGCWGISARFGYSEDDFKQLLYTQHEVDSTTKITKEQWLKTYNTLFSTQLAIDEASDTICVDKDAWVTFLIAQYSPDQPWSAIAAWMDDDDRLRELQGEFSRWQEEQTAMDEAEKDMP